jgi:hypothetical protein
MRKKSGLQKVFGVTVVAVCMLVVFSMGSAEASTAAPSTAAPTASEHTCDSFSAIPMVVLLLPIAAVAAYVLEWATAKTHKPEQKEAT